jgi:hypothetical protein
MCLLIAYFAIACSNSSSPASNTNANLTIVSELSGSMVSKAEQSAKGSKTQANEVDSIKITRIRILITELKLFKNMEDLEEGRMMKTGPFLFEVDLEGKLTTIVSGSVPPAVYNKFKLEFHRFSASETSQYSNDLIFKDFATSDRFSVIIDGITYKDNIPSIFTFKAQTTANLMINCESNLDLTEGSNTTIALQVNPNWFFKSGNSILDPSNSKNYNNIENAIKSCLRAVKK